VAKPQTTIVMFAAVICLVVAILVYLQITGGTHSIDNYDECVAAGNPVLESFPSQCIAGSKHFTDQ